MPFEYRPQEFWTAHGPSLAPAGGSSPEQQLVLKRLRAVLSELAPEITSVIDVGCGQGRLAAVVKEELPEAAYAGVDLAEAQLEGTKAVQPDGEYFLSKLEDFTPGRKWDLVIASEVLMHIPPADIHRAVDNLKALAGKWIIAIEWSQPYDFSVKTAPWNWLYDYQELLGPADEYPIGLQSLFLCRV